MAGLDIDAILGKVGDHLLELGQFEAVNGHEPQSPPVRGLTAAYWMQALGPVPAGSGLAATSARLELAVRLYTPATLIPQDTMDPALTKATVALMAAYSGDFDLGGQVRCVDLLGQAGDPLKAAAGYIAIDDGYLYRIYTITLPMIVNDVWDQVM